LDALRRLSAGAAWGAAATAAMSVVMVGARRAGLVLSTTEPKVITEAGLEVADVGVSEQTTNVLASMAHVGYGSAMGAAFGLMQPRVPVPPVASGAIYGLGIALASYEGWVPAAGIMPSLRHQEPPRRWQLVLSHLVYGAVLGRLVARDATVSSRDSRGWRH
ncbi:MAG TPA: DUF1440 domain-containing protein, partial [bacterium]|nr:DUF1440 domain-containing protein [bacterium]